MTRVFRPLLVIVAAAVILTARPALAGPPLLCFPFEIGAARTLPMGSGSWKSIDRSTTCRGSWTTRWRCSRRTRR